MGLASADDEKLLLKHQPIFENLTNDNASPLHPELATTTTITTQSTATMTSTTSKPRLSNNNKLATKNVDLNEQTDGFITQINVEEAIKPRHDQKYNIHTLDAELLIPSLENNKKAKQPQLIQQGFSSDSSHNFKKDQSFLDSSLTGSGTTSQLVFHQTPLAPILKKHHANTDLNDTQLSDDYYDLNYSNLKELNKKQQQQQQATVTSTQFVKKSKSDLNSISEMGSQKVTKGGSFFSFFPSIPGKTATISGSHSSVSRKAGSEGSGGKAKFPTQRNYFNRNIYVQYLTDKIEREHHDKEESVRFG